jgi:hypothetical protein
MRSTGPQAELGERDAPRRNSEPSDADLAGLAARSVARSRSRALFEERGAGAVSSRAESGLALGVDPELAPCAVGFASADDCGGATSADAFGDVDTALCAGEGALADGAGAAVAPGVLGPAGGAGV